VDSCAFSPDGRRVLSASHDHTLKIWDAPIGGTLITYADGITTASWKTSDSGLIAGDGTGAIRLLKINNLHFSPSILTAWRLPSLSFGCLCCRVWSPASEANLGRIVSCPSCGRQAKLNSFTIDADWRPVAKAWGKKG
jgi:WD40 repeat protein